MCQVPLALFGGSGNYASALFLVAAKGNLLDKVESEILDLVEASKKSPLFSQFIKDLSVPGGTRVKAVQEIFSEAGFSDVTKNFLGIGWCGLWNHTFFCDYVYPFSVNLIL